LDQTLEIGRQDGDVFMCFLVFKLDTNWIPRLLCLM